jgi:hypothetical protein
MDNDAVTTGSASLNEIHASVDNIHDEKVEKQDTMLFDKHRSEELVDASYDTPCFTFTRSLHIFGVISLIIVLELIYVGWKLFSCNGTGVDGSLGCLTSSGVLASVAPKCHRSAFPDLIAYQAITYALPQSSQVVVTQSLANVLDFFVVDEWQGCRPETCLLAGIVGRNAMPRDNVPAAINLYLTDPGMIYR